MVFLEINRALGPPDDTEYGSERFLIARAAADEFWDWLAGRSGGASNARLFTQIMDAAVAKARETTSGPEAGTRREAPGRRPRPTPRARSRLGSGPEAQ
jgi:hypothetical protein